MLNNTELGPLNTLDDSLVGLLGKVAPSFNALDIPCQGTVFTSLKD
jgi:hypothetical protein